MVFSTWPGGVGEGALAVQRGHSLMRRDTERRMKVRVCCSWGPGCAAVPAFCKWPMQCRTRASVLHVCCSAGAARVRCGASGVRVCGGATG